MKKMTAAFLAVLTAGVLAFTLAGCTFFAPSTSSDDPSVTPEPDDPGETDDPVVSDDIGGSTWMDWENVFTGGSTEAYRLYREAKEEGFEGTFVDFLKEIGYSVNADSSVSVGAAVQSVVAINSVFKE